MGFALFRQLEIELNPQRTWWNRWSDALEHREALFFGNGRDLKELPINFKRQGNAIDPIPAQFFDKQRLKIKLLEIRFSVFTVQHINFQ
ncbi:hypothetical protein [Prochlorothrix hollandica]|uniref:hypothetical protein n=1 Tax=Prochlorothrix hollandica TaxID=1223 RepID=UPI001F36E766|nr:hypothetical protein [Prochlorothrix hollandica]